jgi:hypothetical protein
MKESWLFVIFALLPIAASAVGPPAGAETALKAAFPSAKAEWNLGDLNGDDLTDAVALTDNAEGWQNIVALLAQKDGTYSIFFSTEFPPHPRRFDFALIEKGALVYSLNGSGGCCSHYSADYKFRFRDGNFYLVGIESSETGFTFEDDTGKQHEYTFSSSANYLTHKIIYRRATKKRSLELVRPIKDRTPIRLETFFGPDLDTPGERGYINERFELSR